VQPDQLDPVVDNTATSLHAATAWRWQATFTPPSAGTWQLKIFAVHQSSAQLFVDGLDTAGSPPDQPGRIWRGRRLWHEQLAELARPAADGKIP